MLGASRAGRNARFDGSMTPHIRILWLHMPLYIASLFLACGAIRSAEEHGSMIPRKVPSSTALPR